MQGHRLRLPQSRTNAVAQGTLAGWILGAWSQHCRSATAHIRGWIPASQTISRIWARMQTLCSCGSDGRRPAAMVPAPGEALMTRQRLPESQPEMVSAKRGAKSVGRGHHQQTGLHCAWQHMHLQDCSRLRHQQAVAAALVLFRLVLSLSAVVYIIVLTVDVNALPLLYPVSVRGPTPHFEPHHLGIACASRCASTLRNI